MGIIFSKGWLLCGSRFSTNIYTTLNYLFITKSLRARLLVYVCWLNSMHKLLQKLPFNNTILAAYVWKPAPETFARRRSRLDMCLHWKWPAPQPTFPFTLTLNTPQAPTLMFPISPLTSLLFHHPPMHATYLYILFS